MVRETSSALCLFVCSAIRGQETIQGYAKALHIQLQTNIVKAALFSEASFFWKGNFSTMHYANLVCLFSLCFAMKPHCVALSGKQVWPENENIYKLSRSG